MQASDLEIANLIVGIVGSVGTIAALILAIGLGFREVRVFRREAREREDERRAAEQRDRQRQAECVSAMAEIAREPISQYSLGRADGTPAVRPGKRYTGNIDVTNASPLPLYEVKVSHPTATPGQRLVYYIGFVPGGEKGHTHIKPQPDRSLDREPMEVTFRDAAGIWWRRCELGHLHEHDDDPHLSRDILPSKAD